MCPIHVCLVDDHRRIQQAVSQILNTVDDIYLAAWATNGEQAIDLCRRHNFDIVLMDVIMPVMDGVEATKQIHSEFPDLKILVISSVHDHESVHGMLNNGAVGYVTKGALASELISTIRATHDGQSVFSAEVTQKLLARTPPERQSYGLTERELEVLGLMAEGLTNSQIAYELSISQSTVKFHVANVIDKIGVETRSEALVAATKANLI